MGRLEHRLQPLGRADALPYPRESGHRPEGLSLLHEILRCPFAALRASAHQDDTELSLRGALATKQSRKTNPVFARSISDEAISEEGSNYEIAALRSQ